MIITKKPELTDTVRSVYDKIDEIVEYFTDSNDKVKFKRWSPRIDFVGMDMEYNERYITDDLTEMFENNPDIKSYAYEIAGDNIEGWYEILMYSFVTVDGGHGLGYFYYEI